MHEQLIKKLQFLATAEDATGMHKSALAMREAAAALATPPAAVAVPEGWKLVPAEATDDMVLAAEKAKTRHIAEDRRRGGGDPELGLCAIYRAALTAAPTPAPVATEAVAQATLEYEIELLDGTPAHITCHGSERDMKRLRSRLEYFHNREAELRALLASAPAGTVGDGWIAVGDRLPDMPSGYVLVHCEGGNITNDFFCRNREFHRHAGKHYSRKVQGKESGYFQCSHRYGYRVTHWQPLPPAPAATKKEN